jgi:ferrochelatase
VPLGQPGRESYVADLRDASARVAAGAGVADWDLVYQSRSGPPSVPWLEPDVGAHLEKLHGDGVEAVALVPIGFVSAHMEVAYDLDFECAELAARLGMSIARADTADTDPRFAGMAVDLLTEEPTPCGAGCCRS